jgi:hypothetical protein
MTGIWKYALQCQAVLSRAAGIDSDFLTPPHERIPLWKRIHFVGPLCRSHSASCILHLEESPPPDFSFQLFSISAFAFALGLLDGANSLESSLKFT